MFGQAWASRLWELGEGVGLEIGIDLRTLRCFCFLILLLYPFSKSQINYKMPSPIIDILGYSLIDTLGIVFESTFSLHYLKLIFINQSSSMQAEQQPKILHYASWHS